MTLTWHHAPTSRTGTPFDLAWMAVVDAVRVHTGERQDHALARLTWEREMRDRGWSLVRVDHA